MLNHKLYVLMYEIAINQLDIEKMKKLLAHDLKNRKNVKMAICVVQTALMAN